MHYAAFSLPAPVSLARAVASIARALAHLLLPSSVSITVPLFSFTPMWLGWSKFNPFQSNLETTRDCIAPFWSRKFTQDKYHGHQERWALRIEVTLEFLIQTKRLSSRHSLLQKQCNIFWLEAHYIIDTVKKLYQVSHQGQWTLWLWWVSFWILYEWTNSIYKFLAVLM